jgi:hypothetical protein
MTQQPPHTPGFTAGKEATMDWWWSRDEERFTGPCSSRAEAIMEAWADDADQPCYICQAEQGAIRTDIFQGYRIAEDFDDANEENCDPDGDGISSWTKAEKWHSLADRLNGIVGAFARENGLRSWAFKNQTALEFIDIPAVVRALNSDGAPDSQGSSQGSGVGGKGE